MQDKRFPNPKFSPSPMKLPVTAHIGLGFAAVVAFFTSKPMLDASYVSSRHPVDYATGQLSFNGPTIKGYYEVMQQAGTLDIYWQTQFIDFAFIASIFLLGLFLCTSVARLSPAGTWGRRIGLFAAFAAMAGALCDVVENLISFVMLSNPAGFPDWLAIPYSSFAALKFTLITCAMGGLLVSLALGCFSYLWARRRSS